MDALDMLKDSSAQEPKKISEVSEPKPVDDVTVGSLFAAVKR